MPDKEGFFDGINDPDIQASVMEMAVAYERRVEAAERLAHMIAVVGGRVNVDFATYFAHINQISIGEARAERHRKVGYYNELFGGLMPEDVGEPVLVTSLTMLEEMGMIGSFSEQEQVPIEYNVGTNKDGHRWGKINLAFRRLEKPPEYESRPSFSRTVRRRVITDEKAHRHPGGENISTDSRFRTKLYIGQQGVQNWVDIKFPGVGDKAVEPLMEALGQLPTAIV